MWKNICPLVGWRAVSTQARVVTDDKGHSIPANLTVRGPGTDTVTELDGSRIRHDVAYADGEFAPESLTHIVAP